jgi:hypothetical protein
MSNRSVYKYTEEKTSIATMSVPKKAGMTFILFGSEYKPYNDFQPDRHFNDYSGLLKIVEEM